MASVLFDVSEESADLRSGINRYELFIRGFNILTTVIGIAFTLKSVYSQSTMSISLLSRVAITRRVRTILSVCIALGIIMVFTGATGFTCRTRHGVILNFFLTIVIIILEISVGCALLSVQNEFISSLPTYLFLCEHCSEQLTNIADLMSPTIATAFIFTTIQCFLLYIIHRYLLKLQSIPTQQSHTRNNLQLTVQVNAHSSNCSTPKTTNYLTPIGLNFSLSPSSINSSANTRSSSQFPRWSAKRMRHLASNSLNLISSEQRSRRRRSKSENNESPDVRCALPEIVFPHIVVTPPSPPRAPPPTPSSPVNISLSFAAKSSDLENVLLKLI